MNLTNPPGVEPWQFKRRRERAFLNGSSKRISDDNIADREHSRAFFAKMTEREHRRAELRGLAKERAEGRMAVVDRNYFDLYGKHMSFVKYRKHRTALAKEIFAELMLEGKEDYDRIGQPLLPLKPLECGKDGVKRLCKDYSAINKANGIEEVPDWW